MKTNKQIEKLATFIMAEVDGEPSQSEGAGDTAIRVIKKYRIALERLTRLGNGVHLGNSVGNRIAQKALSGTPTKTMLCFEGEEHEMTPNPEQVEGKEE